MKNSIKYLSILLMLGAGLAFTACNKQDDDCCCHPNPKEEYPRDCNTELTFMDPGMCGGMFFKTAGGEYLEVYGYPDRSLNKGDKVKFGYEKFDNSNLIQCLAISQFEIWLHDNGHKAKVVKVRKECLKSGSGICDTRVTYYKRDFCSGDLLKTDDGNLLRAFGLPRNDYKEGERLVIGYQQKNLQNDCQYVREPDEIGTPVDITCCKDGSGDKEPTECNTSVTYIKRDICSGELFKTDGGELLRVFDLPLMNTELVPGNKYTINYEPMVLQNDCTVVRDPNETGKPVRANCFDGKNTKE